MLAERVFNTVELVEAIFCFLRPSDLLSAVQVNRTASKTIPNSPTLQHRLHLRPSPSSYMSTLFDGSDSKFGNIKLVVHQLFDWPNSKRRTTKGALVRVYFKPTNEYGSQVLPQRIGELCRRMLVCQPPIKEMKALSKCCIQPRCDLRFHESASRLTSATGITVGDIYDAGVKAIMKNRTCPNVVTGFSVADGVVYPIVTFEAHMRLKRDDPYVLKYIDYVAKCKAGTLFLGGM